MEELASLLKRLWGRRAERPLHEKLPRDSTAVLLIDMQPLLLKKIQKHRKMSLIKSQIEIIRRCCVERKVPLVVLELIDSELKLGGTIFALATEIKKVPLTFFIKRRNINGFSSDLATRLEELHVKNLFLMGIYADKCVMATAIDGWRKGFKIITSRGVIASHVPETLYRGWYMEYGTYYL